jgi:hypothetical protein
MASRRICSIEGCGKPVVGFGYCNLHYRRLKRHGDPLKGGTPHGAAQRFFRDHVLTDGDDRCLIWPFARNAAGYAVINARDGNTTLVSRRVCEAVHGRAPSPAHEAAHSCGNGANGCVTKGHLYWASSLQNKADMLGHGTRMRGERSPLARLTEQAVHEIRALRGEMRQRDIAAKFGVSTATVCEIQTGASWNWLE